MSQRVVVASLVGAVALGGVAAGGIASATASSEPTVENATARYQAPAGGGGAEVTFTAEVSDDSGVRDLKVLAWPKSSHLDPKAGDLEKAESATCEKTGEETSRCTYTLKAGADEAAGLPRGPWKVSVLAKGEDGDTTFVPDAATFTVPR